KLLRDVPLKVPTMWLQGLWDQEDMYGANHSYAAMEGKDRRNDRNFLVMGPWRHSQVKGDGRSLGALQWNGDTALQFRRDVLKPFFDQYLVPGAPKADTPPVLVYDTGADRWDRLQAWPVSCEKGCAAKSRPLYLHAGGALSFDPPAEGQAEYDEYVSDPAKPVPYLPRPVSFGDREGWTTWLVHDQRFVDGRPDVLTWASEPLTEPPRITGMPKVRLPAATSSRWPWRCSAAATGRAWKRPSRSNPARYWSTGSTCPMPTTPSSRAIGSWCRCSPRCSRSTTATRRPSCRTSSSPSPGTTARPTSGSGTRPRPRASSSCRCAEAAGKAGNKKAGPGPAFRNALIPMERNRASNRWSGRQDLNLRLLRPERSALPG